MVLNLEGTLSQTLVRSMKWLEFHWCSPNHPLHPACSRTRQVATERNCKVLKENQELQGRAQELRASGNR